MLNDIVLDRTKTTPYVSSDAVSGTLNVVGESYPENSVEFYQPIFDWVKTFVSEEKRHLAVHFQLTYFNTSSSKCLLDLLDLLQSYHYASSGAVEVFWHYEAEDEDMLESGREFAQDLDLTFTMVEGA